MNTEKEPKQVDAESVETIDIEPKWSERLLSADHWLRFVFMVLFAMILGVASYVITVLVLIQFVWALVTGEGSDKLREFGSSLSQYIHQILRFLTYNSEEKPFPFTDWPESEKQDS
ncbi:MAG: hypothetical protein ACJAUP_000247 [Cellvibrionaceae bacterium]|jgi:hypothetical protein